MRNSVPTVSVLMAAVVAVIASGPAQAQNAAAATPGTPEWAKLHTVAPSHFSAPVPPMRNFAPVGPVRYSGQATQATQSRQSSQGTQSTQMQQRNCPIALHLKGLC